MRYPSVKAKARFVLLTMLLGSTLGVFNTSYRGDFFAYGDPSSYEYVNGGATQELAGGMLVLCQDSLEYTRSVLKDLEGEDSRYLTEAWEKLAKAEEQYHVAQIQIFEYLDYHASVQHSRRVLELCAEAVELASRIGVDDGDVLVGGASDFDLAWGAIEKAYTLLDNLEDAMSKLNGLNVSVVESVLGDARGYIELAETQLTYGDLDAAEGSVNEAMDLLGQAMDLLQIVSQDKKIDKVLTLIESYEEQLRELEGKVVDTLVMTEDFEESLNYVINVFQDARDKIQLVKNQLEEEDLNLVIDELDTIFDDVLESLSLIGWPNDSDTQPLQFQNEPEETDTLQEDNTEPPNDEGPGTSEPEEAGEEPKNEGKLNNGKSPNKDEPIVEDEPVPEEPKDEPKNKPKNKPKNEPVVEDESAPEPEDEPVPEEPKDEEKSNNGNPQNDKEPEPEPEDDDDEDDDDEDSSVIDKLVEKIKKWYDRKKDKKDKKDKGD